MNIEHQPQITYEIHDYFLYQVISVLHLDAYQCIERL
jgi:hypothetical protein